MYVENEFAEVMTIGDHDFEEVIEEYKEKILMQEEVLEPPLTDLADTVESSSLVLVNWWNPKC